VDCNPLTSGNKHRRDAEGDAVVMSLDYYNSLVETLHLLSTPANVEALARAIHQDQAGQSNGEGAHR
jgi:hypothetical protein